MKTTTDVKPKANTMQTVDRALDLINYLANARDGLSVVDLSRLLGITRTS
ncbi:MAG: helix-turn-helix domain-containing protein, partial [Clostridia bacterium]|nr:helix-turn-helix domain-containing protein [Clostridia bacterium]